jgi:hypothetical protein
MRLSERPGVIHSISQAKGDSRQVKALVLKGEIEGIGLGKA